MAGSWWSTQAFALLVSWLLLRAAQGESFATSWTNATVKSSSTAQSHGLGDFVAAGLDMTRSSDNGPSTTASEQQTMVSQTEAPSSAILDAALSDHSPSITSAPGNVSSVVDGCWQQWTQYWSPSDTDVTSTMSYFYTTKIWTITLYDMTNRVAYVPETITTTVYNGAHPQNTFTTVTLVPTPVDVTSWPSRTLTTTNIIPLKIDPSKGPPSCSLPGYVPACQSSWDDYFYYWNLDLPKSPDPVSCTHDVSVNGIASLSCSTPAAMASWNSLNSLKWRSKPSCTQAMVTGSACSREIDRYMSATKYGGNIVDGVLMHSANVSTYTTTVGTADQATTVMSTSWFWDPSQSFAPGCTLGCQSCQINGGTVQLYYWPPSSSMRANASHSAITGINVVSTLVTLGTTLTSPTVYISFDSLYARDSCSAFSKTYTDQIIAITNTASLSSLYGWNSHNGLLSSASFNFTDLYVSPVPDNIYQSQPRCASSMAQFGQWNNERGGFLFMPANWTCPRTAEYDPILSIPNEVRDRDPEWKNCIGGINGVYDPPIALTSADSIALPTVPGANPSSTQDAAPASSPKPTAPPVTAQPNKPASITQPSGNPKQTQVNVPASEDPNDPDSTNAENNGSQDSSTQIEDHPQDSSGQPLQATVVKSPPDTSVADDPATQKASDKPSTAQSPQKSEGSSDPSNDQTPQQADSPSQPKQSGLLTTAVAAHPTGDSTWHITDQPSATAGSDRLNDGSPTGSTDKDSESGENALSVLLSALSSAQNTMTADISPIPTAVPSGDSSIASINGSQESSHTTDSATQDLANTSVFQHTDEDPIATREGDLVSVSQGGRPAVAATDNVDTGGTHTLGTTSDDTAVANPPTHTTDMALDPLAHATSFTVNGQPITASRQGSAMVLADGSQTETALPGSTVRLGSQNLDFHSDGTTVVAGTATFAVPNTVDPDSADNVSKWTKDGSVYTAVLQDGSAKLVGPEVTTTLPAGAKATIAGEIFSMPSGDPIVNTGNTVSSEFTSLGATSGLESSLQNINDFLVSATVSGTGGAFVFHQGSLTFTLNPGHQTRVAGHTLSANSGASAVVVDGERSIFVAPASTADASSTSTTESGSSTEGGRTSDAEPTTATSLDFESAAGKTWTTPLHISYALAWTATLLALL